MKSVFGELEGLSDGSNDGSTLGAKDTVGSNVVTEEGSGVGDPAKYEGAYVGSKDGEPGR